MRACFLGGSKYFKGGPNATVKFEPGVQLLRGSKYYVTGLVPRLQGRSEDETIGPGVPRKLAFAVRVCVSRNRSHSFTGGSRARCGPTGLHRHPRVAKYTCVYDVQLLAIWRIPLLAVVLLLSLALRVGLLRRLPTSPCPYDRLERRTLCTGLFSQVGLLVDCTTCLL